MFGDSDRPIENEDLPNLKYVECVFKEALRLYPSIPFVSRRITKNSAIGKLSFWKSIDVPILYRVFHLKYREKYSLFQNRILLGKEYIIYFDVGEK